LGQSPARLTAEQAGWMLNCQAHDIPALISARLLKPLGSPSQNSTKYFSTADVLEIAKDRAWLVKVTNTICHHWQKQNARKKDHAFNDGKNGHVSLAAASWPLLFPKHTSFRRAESCASTIRPARPDDESRGHASGAF